MTKRAAAANARKKINATNDAGLSGSSSDEASSLNLDDASSGSSSDDAMSIASSSSSSAAEESDSNSMDISVKTKKIIKGSSEPLGFETFENYVLVQDDDEKENDIPQSDQSTPTAKVILDSVKLEMDDVPISLGAHEKSLLEGHLKNWIKCLKSPTTKLFEKDTGFGVELKKSTKNKFDCPFSACSKDFANYNGLLYHFNNGCHSVKEFRSFIKSDGDKMEFDQLISRISPQVWPIKLAGFACRFSGMKKCYECELSFEQETAQPATSTTTQTSQYINKKEFSVYPNKCLLSSGNKILKDSMNWALLPKINEYDIISSGDANLYFPEEHVLNLEYKKSLHSLKVFDAISLESTKKTTKASHRNRWVINSGISVWGLDFCPLSVASESQYIAIGGYKNTHENRVLGAVQTEEFEADPRMDHMIQIWELKKNTAPRFALGIAHSYGCLYDLKWCPNRACSTSKKLKNGEINRLGFLAATFGDGSCRVFSVPIPCELKHSSKESGAVILSMEPLFEARIEGTLLWKLDWISSTIIVNGTSDGRVVIWDIEPYMREKNSEDPVYLSAYFAHDCAIRKIHGCPNSHWFFITSGNDGRFLLHDIRQPWIISQLHRTKGFMTGISWIGSRLAFADVDNVVRLCQYEEDPTSSEGSAYSLYNQLKTSCIIRHQSPIWDIDGSPFIPFLASCSSDLVITNVNRIKRHYSPVDLTLYSLAYDSARDVLQFEDNDSVVEKPFAKMSNNWTLCPPESSVHKVCWNKNTGHEFEIASAGRSGFVRIESCLHE